MFEPRPEMRTATRLRSGIMRGAPAGSADRASAIAGYDLADLEDLLAGTFKTGCHRFSLRRRDDQGHANPAIERACHLIVGEIPAFLKHLEDRRQWPIHLDPRMTALG